jgi:hypothetical protein
LPVEATLAAGRIPWSDLRFDERDEDGKLLVLGQGPLSTVLAATLTSSHTFVAVKQLPADTQLPPAAVAALEAEAALQARLSHEHVVRVYGFAVSTDPARPKYGLVMARLHEPLQALLCRAASGGEPPAPLAWRLSAARQMAAGLAHLHARRVVHGDLKPANVMLTAPEMGSALQLADFGLAREVAASGSATCSAAAAAARGTRAWMAPELLQLPALGAPFAQPSFRTDVFAWGVVAWQVLALAPQPYPGLAEELVGAAVLRGDRPDLAALPEGTPEGVRALIVRCLHPEAGARPRSGGDVLEALLVAFPEAARLVPLPPRAAAADPDSPAPVPAWRAGALVLAECPICTLVQQPGVALGCGDAAHVVCNRCALQHARAELCVKDGLMVHCPLCAPRAAPVSEAAVMEVQAWAIAVRGEGALRPLSLQNFAAFAGMAQQPLPPPVADPPPGLFKRCPGTTRGSAPCGAPIQHARGHHCHHISPGTGCTQCGTHFCYACLRVYQPGEGRVHCPNGCPVFCTEACDCPDCVDCAPGRPCDLCDNSGSGCWACHPARRPGAAPAEPLEAAAAADAVERALVPLAFSPGDAVTMEGRAGTVLARTVRSREDYFLADLRVRWSDGVEGVVAYHKVLSANPARGIVEVRSGSPILAKWGSGSFYAARVRSVHPGHVVVDFLDGVSTNQRTLLRDAHAVHEDFAVPPPERRRAAPPVAAPSLPAVGDRIRGNFKGWGWPGYPGRVARVNADGTFDLAYDDGDTEAGVPLARLRTPEGVDFTAAPAAAAPRATTAHAPAAGDRIRGNFKGWGWPGYPGRVARVNADGTFDLAYDDGDTEAGVPLARLRTTEGADFTAPAAC